VVHRDLKPDNIMLLPPSAPGGVERVRLLDFGIAKVTAADADVRGPTLTRAGLVFGTPDYMAPEQATGAAVDARVDLYASGVILFELLTGRRPFVADNAVSVMTMHITVEPPMPSLVAPEAQIPGAFDRIVKRAMEKDPLRRYGSAAEFMAALDSAVAPPAITAAAHHPTTRILSVAGTGGAGKPSRITLTLDVDNLRSRMVALGRLLRRMAGFVWALLRAGITRGWARLPPRLRWPVAVSLVLAMLGGAVWMASARPEAADPEEEFERAVEEATGARAVGDDSRKPHEGAKKKKRKRWEDALPF
jgi:Protein kinase domain